MPTGERLEEEARQLLREKVGYPAKTSMRRVDKALGKHLGYTSRLLAGASRLRFDQVAELLAAVDEDAVIFLNQLARRLATGDFAPEVEVAVQNFDQTFDPRGEIARMNRRLSALEERLGEGKKA